jgi:hypothetical protein
MNQGTRRLRITNSLVALGLLVLLSVSSVVSLPTSAFAFSGYHCRISTCRFFTSSYYNAQYFYDRETCDQWEGLSRTYLEGFRTARALRSHFQRTLHASC